MASCRMDRDSASSDDNACCDVSRQVQASEIEFQGPARETVRVQLKKKSGSPAVPLQNLRSLCRGGDSRCTRALPGVERLHWSSSPRRFSSRAAPCAAFTEVPASAVTKVCADRLRRGQNPGQRMPCDLARAASNSAISLVQVRPMRCGGEKRAHRADKSRCHPGTDIAPRASCWEVGGL